MIADSKAITITNLSKIFKGGVRGEVRALDDVSFDVHTGEIFGLLGPNGAGKTTMVKLLLGSLYPTSGTASINGYDISTEAARHKIGFLPENHQFPSYLTGRQMLLCFGGMAGLPQAELKTKIDFLLKMVGMLDWQDDKLKKYSKGMMQRLGLAQALINDPEIIFLDEPTDGVDPIGRREIRDILLNLKKQGKTIFLNSHLLSEVESVCDRVGILNKGKLIKTGPVEGLISTKPAYRIETAGLTENIIDKIKESFPHANIEDYIISITLDNSRQINRMVDLLRQSEIDVISVTPIKVSLEDSFMRLIKGEEAHE